MIKIVYDKLHNRVTVTGHADGEDAGHNIPCGCASILAYTLAANVEHLMDMGAARVDAHNLGVGYAEIQCTPVHRADRRTIRDAYEAVCVGFEVLAGAYPETVSYEIRG